MKRELVAKRDAMLLNFLKNHKGSENAVKVADILEYLKSIGYGCKTKTVCTIVRKLMFEYSAPICYKNSSRDGGYYWAKSRKDIEITISDIDSRIAALEEHKAHLQNFIIN